MELKSILDQEAIFRTLKDLISINSVNPSLSEGDGEIAIGQYIAEFFRKRSIPVELQPVVDGRFNVLAKLEGRRGGDTILLEAHMDTVSEKAMSIEPFRPAQRGNLVYGLGSCDTKGGLAAMMHALQIVHDHNLKPSATAILAAVVDEEFAFQGVKKLVESKIKAEGDRCGTDQPEDHYSLKGNSAVADGYQGRAAHSSKPYRGLNAIGKMSCIVTALERKLIPQLQQRMHPLLGAATLNVGRITGGIQVNIVPDHCVIEVDRRTLPGETREQVWKEMNDFLRELQAEDPELQVGIHAPTLEDPPLETNLDEKIVKTITCACAMVAGSSAVDGVPFGSDASKLSEAGIPSVIFGPGSIDKAHTPDECIELDQVLTATEVYVRSILNF